MSPGDLPHKSAANVLVFNPFAEAFIALGRAFTPVKHQGMLAEDLATLPQFICSDNDIVLVPRLPSGEFLDDSRKAGFPVPRFVELRDRRIDPDLVPHELGALRPWAWSPDSVEMLEPLFGRVKDTRAKSSEYFNERIRQLYSKAWSADFFRRFLRRVSHHEPWLCHDEEAGVVVNVFEGALDAVRAIRKRGHHRVVIKEAHGLAGNNALRLWEPELLPQQLQWLARSVGNGRELVVEPWQEREADFSVHLEMDAGGLKPHGYTGLVTDLRGQFLANWAEPGSRVRVPATIAGLLSTSSDVPQQIERLYAELFSMLEVELQDAGFAGPISIDAFVYRAVSGTRRLKPVVEINPRYTMGRLTLELAKHAHKQSYCLFRLLGLARAREDGFTDFASYGRHLEQRAPLQLDGHPPLISQGAICLNDPARAQVCLATFEVSPTPLRWNGRDRIPGPWIRCKN